MSLNIPASFWGAEFGAEKGPNIHLVAICASGHAYIYTIEKDARTHQFQVSPKPVSVDAVPQCFPWGSCILDPTAGTRCFASRSHYSGVAQGQSDGVNTYWITIGQKGARCSLNGDGDRLGRVDFGSKNGIVESAHVVHKHSEDAVITSVRVAKADALQDLALLVPSRIRANCLFIQSRVLNTCTRYP